MARPAEPTLMDTKVKAWSVSAEDFPLRLFATIGTLTLAFAAGGLGTLLAVVAVIVWVATLAWLLLAG